MQELNVIKGDSLAEFEVTHPELILTTGWTCSMSVLDDAGTAVLGPISVTDTTDAEDAFLVSLTPAQTSSLSVETYKMTVELNNASLDFNQEFHYLLNVDPEYEAGTATDLIRLTRATNSFATYEDLLLKANQMPLLKMVNKVSRRELKAALIQAYYNICLLTLDFELTSGETDPSEFDTTDLDELTTAQLDILLRAQITEADMLLGANPIEDRRRAGLLSDSVGESAHFFRTSKPLELPVYKETARVLKGVIVWAKRIGRG